MNELTRGAALGCALLLVALVLVAPAVAGDLEPNERWVFGFGKFDDAPGHSQNVHLEHRSAHELLGSWKQFEELDVTTDGGIFGGIGIYEDFRFTGSLVLTPRFGMGLYREGNDKDLGSLVEFRAGGNIAWRFPSGVEVGWMYEHLGNLGLSAHDPGAESFLWTVAVPFGSGSKGGRKAAR
jgi:hypothetical protein